MRRNILEYLSTLGDVLQCPQREFVRKDLLSKHKNLEGIYEYLVDAIDRASSRETTRINPVLNKEVRCCYTGELIRDSPSEEDVLEIIRSNWIRVFGYDRSATRAFATYLPSDGKIYLQKDEWCLCNFVHETLHSRSILSKRNGPYRNLRFVYEGITELLTGWLLQSKFKKCFSVWSKIETCFLKSYMRWVKLWNYFSWKVGIQGIINIYFDHNLADPLQSLVKLAVQKGYSIQNIFSPYEQFANLESKFTNELSRSFGADFNEYMSSAIPFLEPGKV